MKTFKTIGIIVVTLLMVVLLIVFSFQGVQNKAIVYEEQINESYSGLQNTYKRRVDLLYNLADCLKSYNSYEANTIIETIKARSQDINSDISEIKTAIKVTAENYPQLQSSANYQTYMNELSMTENQILEYRNNFNAQIKNYNRYVRKFPTNWILNILGYEVIDYKYLEYDDKNLEDAPQNLLE